MYRAPEFLWIMSDAVLLIWTLHLYFSTRRKLNDIQINLLLLHRELLQMHVHKDCTNFKK